MSTVRARRGPIRRLLLATRKGVRFTLTRDARPGDRVMTPAEAAAYLLDLTRKKGICRT